MVVVCWLLLVVVRCVLFAVCCLVFDGCSVLFVVVRCSLSVVCCVRFGLLFVVR